ncbi:Hsp70 family protein [Epidermidibacterium keratini]|uniref:Hsp70 family protein n=1 Tax=Epidermidibacterium keratini TaxID=1891644 RepID=A0A7L4YM73_9ACTN|nr:Hsp70 family protein [Epidermidibacterium keratini]QHC00240.1 Hsp70 family protein [Epidermidibacterium keratini]
MRVLAVDFGTSNTVAAVSVDGAPPRLLTIDGSPLVPSSIYLNEDGTIAVGRDADRQARIDPSRYEPNPKRRIDDGDMLLGTDVIPVRTAIAAVLGRVLQEFQRQFGGERPDVVRLTHPARWRKSRREVLMEAAREAGVSDDPILVPEPVGAATHFATQGGHNMAPGSALAVYDLGGGTFDVAIVQKTDAGYEVIAEQGLPDLGGLDFDHAILEHVGKAQEQTNPDEWSKLNRPTDTASRRAQRALAVDIKEGKEALSRNPHTDIAFPAPFDDVHLTRSEFEDLIRPNLARSVELLQTTIDEANLTPKQLAGVYLVGGSSRVPLVARLIQEGMGITPTTLDQPESTVASGALYLNVGGKQGGAARPNPTASTPLTQQPPGRPPQGGPMGGPTRRVDGSMLPQIRTVRPSGPPQGNIRRIPRPGEGPGGPMPGGPNRPATGPNPRPATGMTRPGQNPATGPNPRPATGMTRPPTGTNPGPATGTQRPGGPAGPASGPMAGPARPNTGGVPAQRPTTAGGPQRPATGPNPRPATGANPRPATGSIGGPNAGARPAAQRPATAASSSGESGMDRARPLIWGAIVAVGAILIVVLILLLQ